MKSLTLSLRSLLRATLPACFTLLFVSAAAFAQQTDATVTGEVRDQNGAVVAGAQLSARNLETGFTRTTTSDGEGRYTFASLPVGAYEIRGQKEGFRAFAQSLRVTIGETSVVNPLLEVAAVGAAVEVNDTAVLVNTQTPELSYLVSERAISELPLNGRNYTDLALLQPGVVAYPHREGGSIVAHGLGVSVNGQDPRSNVYLIDGTPQNDFTNGPAGSAANTVLGQESIREFRVEANSYSAEFGRNSGGQINAVTKSGSNQWHGSLYEFHRNDNFDARNFFDSVRKPEFKRNQFGGSVGGPFEQDKTFFFANLEILRERLGRTVQTVVPDAAARRGELTIQDPNFPNEPCRTRTLNVTVSPAVRPYLGLFPLPNGPAIGCTGNLAAYSFGFSQEVDQYYTTGRVDHNWNDHHQSFVRYTLDDAEQQLPTDFPQFPRAFRSRNQFFTAEHRYVQSGSTVHTSRFGFSRTRIGQQVEANLDVALPPFVPGREFIGNIDIGGIPRFGPQTSVSVRLTQNVFGFEHGVVHTRGRHLIKAGGLVERYQDNMVNPTFSLGIFTFNTLQTFLTNQPARFLGLTPEGALDRYWRFTLFAGYVQDTYRVHPRLTLNAGLRYETTTMPVDIYGRDSALPNILTDRAPTTGELYENPTRKNISPRVGFAWDVFGDGKTSLRGGYGIYYNTNNQQNLIVTVTNPPATPRLAVAASPTCTISFPAAPLNCAFANSIRPVQFDLDNPYVNVYNVNLQRELWWNTVVTVGYAGSRGIHLLRSGDANTAVPVRLSEGHYFFPAGAPRRNTAFSTIELKSSDGNSWYNAGILEVRKRWGNDFNFQSSYTFSRNIDTTQASTFFSDATNGTTSAMPEFPDLNYNKGLSDYHAKHNWVVNFTWAIPFARALDGWRETVFDDWQLAGIGQARSGNPLTVFLQANRSRSLWQPSVGPGIGVDRPSIAPGFDYESAVTGNPDQYFDPAAFVLQPAGFLGNIGRGAFIGPNYRTFDLSATKNFRFASPLNEATNIQFRVEAFNLFNRANFATPELRFGTPSFGRIRQTVTPARQIQLGVRLAF